MNTLPVSQLEKIKSLFEYAKELERDNFNYLKEIVLSKDLNKLLEECTK